MSRRRIAIACQGGGSQCAFVAGALDDAVQPRGPGSLRHRRPERHVGRGAHRRGGVDRLCSRRAQGDPAPIGERVVALWKDLSAQTPQEILFDKSEHPGMVRLIERGLMPSIASSPSSLQFQMMSRMTAAMLGRPEFTDLRALLVKHIDFDAHPVAGAARQPGAAGRRGRRDRQGNFKIFSSAHNEIKVEAVLASAAIPNLFPAVWVDGHAYWDGIFSSNPPIVGFLQKRSWASYRAARGDLDHPGQPRAARRRAGDAQRHLRSPQPPGRQPEPAARAADRSTW